MKPINLITIVILLSVAIGCGKDHGQNPAPEFRLFLTPAENTVHSDSTILITVYIEGVDDLFAASFDLIFDTSIVATGGLNIPPSSLIGSGSSISHFGIIPGGISIGIGRIQTPSDDNVQGSGPLANIAFRGLQQGRTIVDIQNVSIIDESGQSNSNLSDLILIGGNIDVN